MADHVPVGLAGLILALVALALAAAHDIAVRTVPNGIAALAACGAAIQALAKGQPAGALAMGAGLLALSWPLWRQGWFGGGDMKLLAAAGPLVPPAQALDLLLAISLAGGLLALPYLPGRRVFGRPGAGRPATLLGRLVRCERWRLSRRGPLPYAVAIAAGLCLVLVREG